MSSTFTASEAYGAGPTVVDPTSALNLLTIDAASGADTTTTTNANPIAIPGAGTAYSYERWFRGKWTGVGTSVTSITVCHHTVTPPAGCTVYGGCKGSAVYVQSVITASSVATNNISTIDTTFADASSLGSGTVQSFYEVLQLRVASTCATPGNLGNLTIRFGWNEI
jgi:hypothetical protein